MIKNINSQGLMSINILINLRKMTCFDRDNKGHSSPNYNKFLGLKP